MTLEYSSAPAITAALRRGRPVIVLDAPDRENEADLILSAALASVEEIAFMIRHTSGILCVSMPAADLSRLGLHRLQTDNPAGFDTPFTMPVDYKPSSRGGVSAAERLATIQALINPATDPQDLGRPGHVFPLMADPGGLAARAGHTEAGLHLMRAAGLAPAAVLSELMNDDGTMMLGDDLAAFAASHDLLVCTIFDMMNW